MKHLRANSRLPMLLLIVFGTAGWTAFSFQSASRAAFWVPPGVERSVAMLRSVCSGAPETRMLEIAVAAREASTRYQLAEELLLAMMSVESRCIVGAKSRKGALGLMQIMPATAKSLGIEDPSHIRENVFGGAQYLSMMLQAFNGDLRYAVAAYNAGPGAVRKHGKKLPPYPETKRYVAGVLERYEQLKKLPQAVA